MIPNPFPGCFIAFEGIDGCGKSKQFEKVISFFRNDYKKGLRVFKSIVVKGTKEPGRGRFWGAEIYKDLHKADGLHATNPFGFQSWYACDSKENLRRIIIPALWSSHIVFADRFRPSMVYGARTASEIPALMLLNQVIIGEDFIWPDAIFIFNVTVETAIKRLMQSGKLLDGHENKIALLKQVRDNYLAFGTTYPNCHIIDGEGSLEEIFDKILPIAIATVESKPGSAV